MWIESHQTLRGHPKVRRMARMLDVPQAQVIGHLHMLWWWALDHAFDGDVSTFDAMDIADAGGWDGDPEAFVDALVACGPGDAAGFVEVRDGRTVIHDWLDYTAALRQRRKASARGAHMRWHVGTGAEPGTPRPDVCDLCAQDAGGIAEGSAGGIAEGNAPNQTEPNPTEPDPSTSDVPSDPVDADDPDVSDGARTLTRHFAARVKANGHRVPAKGTRSNRTWLVEMDRLLRIDGADPDEVRHVIDWCAADVGTGTYPGESVNVRSVPKFRQRYSELRLRAARRNGAARTTPSGTGYSEEWPDDDREGSLA